MTNTEVLQERLNYIKTKKVPPMPDEFVGEGRSNTIGAFGFSALAFMYGIIPILLCTTFIVPIFDKSEFVKHFDFFKFISGNGDSNMMMIIFIISIAFGLYGIGAFISNIMIEQGEDPIYEKLYAVEAQKTLQAYNAMAEEYQQKYDKATREYKTAVSRTAGLDKQVNYLSGQLSYVRNALNKAQGDAERYMLADKKKEAQIINLELELAKLKQKIQLQTGKSAADYIG